MAGPQEVAQMVASVEQGLGLDPPKDEVKARAPTRAWAAPIAAVAAAGLFTLIIDVVHFGFSKQWADPSGYVLALLRPLFLAAPAYVLLRIALGLGSWREERESLARPVGLASLSLACYAPVIWFYLVTSPTPTYPLFALAFGSVAFWVPFIWDVLRRARPGRERSLALAWVILMGSAEVTGLCAHLAAGIDAARAIAAAGGVS
jgi:hypothetical protein